MIARMGKTAHLLRKILLMGLILALATACTPTATPSPTATLPPPTQTPVPSATPAPSATPIPTQAVTPTAQSNCIESALFLADVTILDNTNVAAGQAFTKTWKLRNSGTCTWNNGYSLVFIGGDAMSGPASVAFSETEPGADLLVSIDLTAPAASGAYTGFYELRNPAGQVIPVGTLTSIWVKITVGTVTAAPPVTGNTSGSAATSAPSGTCSPSQNSGYASQVLALINTARAENGLAALNANDKLAAAAQAHSDDMACNNFLSHTGSNGSNVHGRVVAAGYAPSYSEEIIFASGTPQDAFNWWMNDQIHRDAILNPNAVHAGVGYTYVSGSAYGGYYTVDFGAP